MIHNNYKYLYYHKCIENKYKILKIYSSIDEFSSFSPCVFTLGVFDGVHIGHKKIIKHLLHRSYKKYTPVLLTFDPHPRKILNPKKNLLYLNTLSEKIKNLRKIGIKHLIIQPFTLKFSKLSTKDFFNILQFKIKEIIIGYDSHIGRNRYGSYNKLKKLSYVYGFNIYKIYPCKLKTKIISSTNIRKSLLLGNIKYANKALGYFYTISGYVVKGKGIGKSIIKFPTANIKIDSPEKLIPKNGVYAVKINYLNNIYKGMLNIGFNPTINKKNKKIKIEVHIFNFSKNIYGNKIDIFIINIIRNEKKFSSIQELKKQIQKDEINIKNFFSYEEKN
ncbi:bifunctional riboflavin kinase/FAD synthetase [Blattabacterium cuenoti]|uniref:bifunctional riboflavin kinase/FAD synthetase n=1 Tax=Blattabacterium cuenoti TaxID=1653831 RepID=UPI00293B9DE3|nr:bifunctional riboflavin kinase/FAD synthetase [Blattabacterium cuenoti]